MKKESIILKIRIILLVILIFYITFPPVMAQGIRHCTSGLTGDATEDNILDIADPIYVLNYLFRAGSPPSCLERGDVNDDGKIDLSDPIYLLEYLYKGGPQPPHLYLDNPQPAFLFIESNPTYIYLPTQFDITDISRAGKIEYCEIRKQEENSQSEVILATNWIQSPDFQGNDLSMRPIKFLVSEPDFLPGRNYRINIDCLAKNQKTGSGSLQIYTKHPNECRMKSDGKPRDVCCSVSTNEGPIYECLKDCDDEGIYEPQCTEIDETLHGKWSKVDNSICNQNLDKPTYEYIISNTGLLSCSDIIPTKTTPEIQKITPLTASTQLDKETYKEEKCKVKSMIIYRKPGTSIPGNFLTPRQYVKQTSGSPDLLGPTEGTTLAFIEDSTGKEIKIPDEVSLPYIVGYGFIVQGEVTANPDRCFEGQFVQETVKKIKNGKEIVESFNTQRFMYIEDQILKKEKHSERVKRGDFPSTNTLAIEEHMVTLPSSERVCPVGTTTYCADRYAEVAGGPGDIEKEWEYYWKQHDSEKNLITWFDNPSYNTIFSSWENNGPLPLDMFKKRELNFIMILEDEDGMNRFYCRLYGLIFENKPEEATATKKVQTTEPECYCKKQSWSNGWIDIEPEQPC